MAPVIKHKFVSPKLDGPDPTIVRPINWNAEHDLSGSGWIVPGMVIDYIGHTVPTGFLEAYGQSVAASAYPNLFAAIVKQATVTFTAGTPGVVNWPSHGLTVNAKVRFRNSGGVLPVEITADVDYYVLLSGYTANSFRISATPTGTEIAFTTGGSGTHTGINAQFGISTDLSTFTVPDFRGRITAGLDTMGGTAAGRLTGSVNGAVLGAAGGAETHTLSAGEIAPHQHNNTPPNPTVNISGLTATVNSGGAHTHTLTTAIVTGSNVAAPTHTHPWSGTIAGSTGGAGSHSHTLAGRHYGATYGGAGTHGHSINLSSSATGSGNSATWGGATAGSSGAVLAAGAHEHACYIDLSGGATSDPGNHTHTLSGTVSGTVDAGGGHNHTWSGTVGGSTDSGGAHTHTATVGGTATSTQAAYMSDANAGGGAHNNVQPTFVVRKVLYAG